MKPQKSGEQAVSFLSLTMWIFPSSPLHQVLSAAQNDPSQQDSQLWYLEPPPCEVALLWTTDAQVPAAHLLLCVFSIRGLSTHQIITVWTGSSLRDTQVDGTWLEPILSREKVSLPSSCSITQSSPTLCEWLYGLQHARLPCPSLPPRVCPNSCPLDWWCHPIISSSVIPFSSCLQSFPALGSFPMSQLFASGGQSIGVSVSASVLPMNIQGWCPLGLTGLISLQSKGLSESFPAPQFENINCVALSLPYGPTLTSVLGKP